MQVRLETQLMRDTRIGNSTTSGQVSVQRVGMASTIWRLLEPSLAFVQSESTKFNRNAWALVQPSEWECLP